MSKKLVIFDFDGTITKKDTFISFLRFNTTSGGFFLKLITSIPVLLLYYCRIVTAAKLKGTLLKRFISVKNETDLLTVGEKFIDNLIKRGEIKNDLMARIREYQEQSAEICIVSASPDIWIKPFCDRFNINYLCTELEFDKEGSFTGKIKGENCNGIEKRKRIELKYNLNEYSTIIIFGNSKGDKQMMELAHEKNWV